MMGERHAAWKGDTAGGWAQGRGLEPRGEEGQAWANQAESAKYLRVCFPQGVLPVPSDPVLCD